MIDSKEIRTAVRHEGGISRRLVLGYMASLSILPLLASRSAGATSRARFAADPFSLGVASGDPDHTGVVLWTRLAPDPLAPDGGMKNEPVEVQWEIAEDDAMRMIVQSGKVNAIPLLGHSVHVEATGLKPDRWYWYRFKAGDATSPIGRTRTLPDPNANPGQLRFAFASCQHYEAGYFTAYETMAKDDLDLVVHLGDYIYEGPARDNGVRKHAGPKLLTLGDYRVRYSQYRTDPLLRTMHSRCPWFLTTDDHEVENNYAADIAGRANADAAEFLIQRANAYQAYYEMMPLRRRSIPRGPDMKLYRKASYGRLAELLILDTRQYRSDQPNGDRPSEMTGEALNPKATLLGAEQRKWLQDSLSASPATWNILGQQVMMGMVDRTPGEKQLYSMDQWPGYARERMALVKYMADRKIKNPVVLTGDIHTNWVNDLREDDRKPEQRIVATEFVGTSISSGGNGTPSTDGLDVLMRENPCVRFYNRQRGYVRCTVTPGTWRSDYVVVDKVTEQGAPSSIVASFMVEAGKPGAQSVK